MRDRIRNEIIRKEFETEGNTGRQDQERKTDMVWSCSKNGRKEISSHGHYIATERNTESRKTHKDMN